MAALPAIPEVETCIHCGLCLSACPTYRVTQLEAESPRGRIHLVKSATEGRIELTQSVEDHLYLCLMCRACETACPSGVQYGRIAEAAREVLGPPGPPPARAVTRFVLRHVLPRPWVLRTLTSLIGLYQRSGLARLVDLVLPEGLRRRHALVPRASRSYYAPGADVLPAIGARRARVAVLSGCAMSMFFADVNAATVRVLRRHGCDVVVPRRQACCGALNTHYGEAARARVMARRNIDAFPTDVDAIITNAAGCGAAMKEYGHLLKDDPAYAARAEQFAHLVRDAAEFLGAESLGAESLGAESRAGDPMPVPMAAGRSRVTVTYQDPCHLAHGQRVRAEPRALLRAIPSLTLTEMSGADRCCGSAGIYNILQPEMADTLLEEKMSAIRATGAAVVVAPNPGCMLQLRYGARRFGVAVRVVHLMDLLDEVGA
jgi:glycolate oxidase iron-sulfur subunit